MAEKRLRGDDSVEEEKGEETVIMGRLDQVCRQMDRFGEMLERVFGEVKDIKTTVMEIREKVDRHEEILSNLKEKVEGNSRGVREVREKVVRSSESVREMKDCMEKHMDRLRVLEERVIDQEARGRRNNLLFHGVEESEGEDCLKIVKDIVKLKCGVSGDVVVERAHRLGRKRVNVVGTRAAKPRPIIARFLDYNDRQRVKEARRHLPANIHIAEDLPVEIREARGRLVPELAEAKRAGRQAWISYPARLFVDGREVRSIRPAGGRAESREEQPGRRG